MGTTTVLAKPEVKKLEKQTSELRLAVEALLKKGIKTKDDFKAFGTKLAEVRAAIKMVGFVCDPFIAIAKSGWEDAKAEKQNHVTPLKELEGKLEVPMQESLRVEREAREADERRQNEENQRETNRKAEEERKEREKQAEQDRIAREAQAEIDRKERAKELKRQQEQGEITKRDAEKKKKEADEKAERERIAAQEEERIRNEQAAKDAEEKKASVEQVVVKSTMPTIAGIKKRVNYYAEMSDDAKLFDAFAEAVLAKDAARIGFLRRFLEVDVKELGKYARDTEDPKVVEATVPGSRAWSEDSV